MELNSKSTLGFYLLKSVMVTLSDGETVRGTMTNLNPGEEYLNVGEERYDFSDIRDVEYVGLITDYHTYQGFGEIEGVTFGLKDFVETIDPGTVFYSEFENTVACHLGLDGAKIVATDLRIISRIHKTHPTKTASADHLYKFEDGTMTCGKFSASKDAAILTRVGGEDTIDLSKVIDIVRVPQVNEVVGIQMLNGEQIRGTVSAISADSIVLIGETVYMVAFADIEAIRYTGYVVEEKNWSAAKQAKTLSVSLSPSNKDTVFWMKKIYLRDQKYFDELDAGDEVSFTSGVNDKGYIAKDVVVENRSTGEREIGYGVILFLPGQSRAIGYIGKEYMSKGYAQDMDVRMNGGDVSFKMSALNFEYQAGKLYVVKYEYVRNEESDVQEALKIDLYKEYVYSEVARIVVDDDGNVDRLSSAAFYLPGFVDCDMQMYLTDGEKVDCILKECGDREIRVLEGETDRERIISLFEIEDVRYFGYISIYRMESGTGHINGKYWFHVNDLRDSNDITDLYVGRGVCFSIEQTNKGKLCAAVDIETLDLKKGLLTSYEGNHCLISVQDMFSQDEVVEDHIFTTLNERAWKILEGLDLDSYSYPVTYSVRRETGKIIILNIEQSSRMGKEVTGYLLKYIDKPTGDFGFLVEEKDIESHLANCDRSGTIYFRETDIIANEFDIDTRDKYYRVSFCKDDEGVAKRLRILEELDFPKMQADGEILEAAAGAETGALPAAEPDTYKIEEKPLADYNAGATPEELEGAGYGFINFCNTNFAAINEKFIKKSLITKEDYNTPDETVIFNPGDVTFVGETNIKTTKYCYLVRYYPGGMIVNPKDNLEYPTVDLAKPIVVLAVFAKNVCHRIEIEGENVIIHRKELFPSIALPSGIQAKTNVFDAPGLIQGEGAIFESEGKKYAYHSFLREDEDNYYVDGNEPISKSSIVMIHRFGIVSAFDLENGIATLNRAFDVSLSVFDSKAINILRNQTTGYRLHVVFGYRGDQVVYVSRVEEEISKYVPWSESVVEAVDVEKKYIRLGDNSTHYTSVLTDGMVNRAFKAGTLIGEKVYVKVVNHLCKEEASSADELVSFAFEIRLKEEMVILQYDAAHDTYHGYRNATMSFKVVGSEKALGKYVGKEVMISFEPANDNYALEAKLESDEEEDRSIEEIINELTDEFGTQTLETILSEKLVVFCEKQVDSSNLLMHGIKLDNQGMPADAVQAQRAYDYLYGQPGDGSSITAAAIAQMYPDVVVEKSREVLPEERNGFIAKRLLTAFHKRSRRIASDVNYVPGELSYVLSVLLRYSSKTYMDYVYMMFLQDFASREDVGNFIRRGKRVEDRHLAKLFSQGCIQPDETVAHMLMLDKKSLEKVCRIMEKQEALRAEIIRSILKIDKSIPEGTVHEMIQELRDRFVQLRGRFYQKIYSYAGQENIAAQLGETLIAMSAYFMEMVCDDDRRIFQSLSDVCSIITGYSTHSGFVNQEEQLKSAYHMLSEIEDSIQKHPCKESVELLYMVTNEKGDRNVIRLLKEEVTSLLNAMYADPEAMPRIDCFPNEIFVDSKQKTLWLIVKNGEKNMKLQTAENITVKLDSFIEGVSVPGEIKIPQKQLAGGDQCDVQVPIQFDSALKESIEIGWEVSYDYTCEFVDGVSRTKTMDVPRGKLFYLQFGGEVTFDKSRSYENPYMVPAAGQPLEDGSMFFGRQTEMKDIRNCIITRENGHSRFIPGSAVIVHGQKKSGKTSLIYQIKNYIRDDAELNDQAIILNFNNVFDDIGGIELLSNFKRNFYNDILGRFSREIRRNHKDVSALLKEHNIKIPDLLEDGNLDIWAAKFDKFFQDFFYVDEGRHTVLLFMDEFTILCTSIMMQIQKDANNSDLANIPNFIKTFSQQYGFVQVIIGHEAMMRVLDTLGVRNHTAEFATSVEIGALEEKDSRDLIIKPMEAVFGRDVYDTPLGKKAIEKLLDLSGCNPTYLMRLCSELFDYYVSDKCQNPRIILSDVENMVKDYVNNMNIEDFDILLVEDGDEVSQPERRKTYRYLKCVTRCAIRSSFDGRTADRNQVSKILQEEEKWDESVVEEIQALLAARRVISITDGGRVKINTGLFQNFIIQKMGMD